MKMQRPPRRGRSRGQGVVLHEGRGVALIQKANPRMANLLLSLSPRPSLVRAQGGLLAGRPHRNHQSVRLHLAQNLMPCFTRMLLLRKRHKTMLRHHDPPANAVGETMRKRTDPDRGDPLRVCLRSRMSQTCPNPTHRRRHKLTRFRSNANVSATDTLDAQSSMFVMCLFHTLRLSRLAVAIVVRSAVSWSMYRKHYCIDVV